MVKGIAISILLVCTAFGVAGCGGTPDTEGQTLADARQDLADAGVAGKDIEVVGEEGDPEALVICEQKPEGAHPGQTVTLRVSPDCPRAVDDDRDRRRGFRFGGRRLR